MTLASASKLQGRLTIITKKISMIKKKKRLPPPISRLPPRSQLRPSTEAPPQEVVIKGDPPLYLGPAATVIAIPVIKS
ncbi:hypothetical protein QR680_016788 [Steinernema hermaphroditum]|uniref:Uncharacterized protein n=1 Tax=Steinernema hermaphroditum TaxID=289476 RepID=A0AA39LN08_9BILA|nr:hypothetical protein QR680_016788 [Steinernema hermaphroditum]